jgi:hypothetical protein
MEENRDAESILVDKSEGNRSLGRLKKYDERLCSKLIWPEV